MRLIAIGDIHGNNDKFRDALKAISLRKTDILIILGDIIDRGSKSKDVLDTILLLRKNGFNNIIYIRGNHEQMLLDCFYDENKEYIWLKNGGSETLKSFKVNFCNQIPFKYIDIVNSSIFYYEYDNFLFIHAGLNSNHENPLKDTQSLLWKRDFNENEILNSKYSSMTIIHGHTPISKEEIIDGFHRFKIINLDNGVYIDADNYGSLVIADLTNHIIKFI